MKYALTLLFFILTCAAHAADRELTLAREMLEDAILRDDEEGMELARGRLIRLAASAADKTVARDAHYLIALSAALEPYTGNRDSAFLARLSALGQRHAEKAIELDPQFADGYLASAMLGRRDRFAKAVELDPKSPAVSFFSALMRSFNPNGPAPPEGVRLFDELAERLDADRAATGRRFGLWDAQAHAWRIMTRLANDDPRAEVLRPMAARLVQQRPDFALGRLIEANVAERRFVAAPAVTFQPFLTDAANDGKTPQHPDVIAVDRAEEGNRLWYRVTFREKLPRSFGVNIAVNRSGDPATGARWWGNGSTHRFDRLVTAWISRDGDRYFGRVGLTDDDGVRGSRIMKIPADIALAMGSDDRSVMIGIPRDALGITDKSTVVVAGGSHLVWNDDAAR